MTTSSRHGSRFSIGSWLSLALLCGCGPEPLLVSANLQPNASCRFVPDPKLSLDQSTFDIAQGGLASSDFCAGPYLAHLLVHNPNSDPVAAQSAEVLLTTRQKQAVRFDRTSQSMPNPFTITATGSLPANGLGLAVVAVIPASYATQLDNFVGSGLIAEIDLHGQSGGGNVSSNHYSLDIDICNKCRTVCATTANAADMGSNPASMGSQCTDLTLGADRNLCVDPGC